MKVKANLFLYSGERKRATPFSNGYRPLFRLTDVDKVSGSITIIDGEDVFPGERSCVEILFIDDFFKIGDRTSFYEGAEELGEIEILEIIEDVQSEFRNK